VKIHKVNKLILIYTNSCWAT